MNELQPVSRNYTFMSLAARAALYDYCYYYYYYGKPPFPAPFGMCFVLFVGKAVIKIRGETRRLMQDFFYNDRLLCATVSPQ